VRKGSPAFKLEESILDFSGRPLEKVEAWRGETMAQWR